MTLPTATIDEPSRKQFEVVFGRPATIQVSAPGRVNLIGEHIDYNDGFVLPAAINRRVTMLAAHNDQPVIRLHSPLFAEEAIIDLTLAPVKEAAPWPWVLYPLGVLAGYLTREIDIPGLDVWIESTVPLGSGLSSSAAVSVAFATLIEHAANERLPLKDKALVCQAAEHDFAGVPCGIMDQFASVLCEKDHLLLIDCRSQEVQAVPFLDPAVSLLISNTGVSHSLASSEYALRRKQCDRALALLGLSSWRDATVDHISKIEDELLQHRARHVISEIARTQEVAMFCGKADWEAVGQRMRASHRSLQLDYEVSCPELDLLVSLGDSVKGVFGSRMTGGGFGGSTVSLVATECAEQILETYRTKYDSQTTHSLEAFIMRPSSGACFE